MRSTDLILAEHASDVAATVSSVMSAADKAGLRARLVVRIARIAREDAECAAVLRRGLCVS
jgi:hypothetical protein